MTELQTTRKTTIAPSTVEGTPTTLQTSNQYKAVTAIISLIFKHLLALWLSIQYYAYIGPYQHIQFISNL